jgi:hypothetical protein
VALCAPTILFNFAKATRLMRYIVKEMFKNALSKHLLGGQNTLDAMERFSSPSMNLLGRLTK